MAYDAFGALKQRQTDDRLQRLLNQSHLVRQTAIDPWAPHWASEVTKPFGEVDEIAGLQSELGQRGLEDKATAARLQSDTWLPPDQAQTALQRLTQRGASTEADRTALDAKTAGFLNELPKVKTGEFLMGSRPLAENAARVDLSNLLHGGAPQVAPTDITPGVSDRESLAARSQAKQAAAGEGEGPMAGQAMGALRQMSSQGGGGGSKQDWQARMEQEELNQARARTSLLEGATPRGQRDTADAALNTEIANLRTGRTGYVEGERAKMEQGAARAKANVEAETFFDDPIAAQRRVQQEANLDTIRTGKVEPQAVAGASREEVARLQGEAQSRRVEREQFTKLLTTLLDDYTRMSSNITINAEDRQRAAEGAQGIQAFLQSLGVNLSGGAPAAGPPIR